MKQLKDDKIAKRLTVLIDGENITSKYFGQIQKLALDKGECVVWRVFGDFSNTAHKAWLDICKTHGFEAMLQLPFASKKNATDIAITVAAMDMLYESNMTGLVLVSNDRDFIPLVRRLRAGGLDVHGIGSCEAGYVFETIYSSYHSIGSASNKARPSNSNQVEPKLAGSPEFTNAVLEILGTSEITLSALGKKLRENYSDLGAQLGKGRLKKRVSESDLFSLSGDVVMHKKI
jgi:uncharacterized protein (TIGR00288 family)